jgi:hypothetical protein
MNVDDIQLSRLWAYKPAIRRQFAHLGNLRRPNGSIATGAPTPLPVVVSAERHKRNFTWLWNYLSHHQCQCGESDIRVLDLHHRDPEQKSFTVTGQLWNYSLARLKAEAAKCDVICKNCHARHHSTRLAHAVGYGLLSSKQAKEYAAANQP